jgi:AcrR family transcriptional regulator
MAKTSEKVIMETARKHFVKNGFTGARMQEIADEAGINKAMLHYYFRSKEKLYHEIVSQTLDTIIPMIVEAFSKRVEFWDRVENIVDTYIRTFLKQPDIPFFIMSELSQKRERFVEEIKKRAHFIPAIHEFIQQINEEVEKGRIKPIAAHHLLLNILGMIVFPFMAKPVFQTIFKVSEPNFELMMEERKKMILEFLKSALIPKNIMHKN